jgi:hypothetical protein
MKAGAGTRACDAGFAGGEHLDPDRLPNVVDP